MRTARFGQTWPRLFMCLLAAAVLLLAGCTDENPAQPVAMEEPSMAGPEVAPDNVDDVAAPNIPALVQAHNRLGMLLFAHLLGGESALAENVFISPTSIALALSMAYNGADGATAEAMAEAMQAGALGRELVNLSSLALLQSLAGAESDDSAGLGVQLDIANSIWHRDDVAVRKDFLQGNERFYQAFVSGLDFAAPSSVDAINGWVNDATHGLIPSVVEQLDPDLVMMLINAVYFKGDWTTPFNAAATRDMPFHLVDGNEAVLPMMYRSGMMGYYADERMQAVRLPYGDDERLAMYVFLPHADVDFAAFSQTLTLADLELAFGGFSERNGELLLPRMDLRYKAKLKEALGALGMDIAFSPGQAEFGRMLEGNGGRSLYLGDVLHQTVLKVDEEGTEAAAVTSIDVRLTSLPVYHFRLTVDRPFVLAIRDDSTGALLFVGAITDPRG